MEFLIFDFEGHSNIYRFYLCDGSFFFLFLAFDLYLQKITFQKYFVYELQPLYSVQCTLTLRIVVLYDRYVIL